jgi:hypothetical protein
MSEAMQSTDETHAKVVARALEAAAWEAEDAREDCGHAPIDSTAQAVLEDSSFTGAEFGAAYDDIFKTIYFLIEESGRTTSEAADELLRIRTELLRVNYKN